MSGHVPNLEGKRAKKLNNTVQEWRHVGQIENGQANIQLYL